MSGVALCLLGLHATAAFAAGDDAEASAPGLVLYGEIDAGIGYLHQSGGKSSLQATQGVIDGSYVGMRGSEPLGDGLRALFRIEQGFSSTDGTLIRDHPMYVGLSSEQYGAVTLGRQYDAMYEFFAPHTLTGNTGGTVFSRPFDNDNANNSYLGSNAIKYLSPDFGGITFGGTYAFSNTAGGMKRNRAYSAGISFKAGDFHIGGAYLHVDGLGTSPSGAYDAQPLPLTPTLVGGRSVANYGMASVRRQDTFGVGATYTMGDFTTSLSYSRALYIGVTDASDGTPAPSIGFSNVELSGTYQANEHLAFTAMLGYTRAASSDWLQAGTQVIYKLSPRTNVYAEWIGQRASAGQVATLNGFDPASGRNQWLLATGIRHNF